MHLRDSVRKGKKRLLRLFGKVRKEETNLETQAIIESYIIKNYNGSIAFFALLKVT